MNRKRSFFPKLKEILLLGLTLFLVAIACPLTYSQPNQAPAQLYVDQAPVMLGKQTIFVLENGVGLFSVQERAQAVSHRIVSLANAPTFQADSIRIKTQSNGTKILADDQVILTVTPADVQAVGQTQQALAQRYRQQIIAAIEEDRARFFKGDPRTSLPLIAAATVAVIVIFMILNRIFPRILSGLAAWQQARISAISVDGMELRPLNRIFKLSINALKFLRLATLLMVIFIYGTFVLSRFPQTARLAASIKQDFLTLLTDIWHKFLDSIPQLLMLALGIFICYMVIELTNSIFKALERGSLSIPGFYPEWASITSRLVNLLIIGFTLALLFPLLPGYQSNAFKGVSLFFGALVSFGATGTVSNMLAGIELTYSRSFKRGDIVKIGDFKGKVVDQRLLITRMRTIENEIITISNKQLLSNQIINYSSSAREYNAPLMLHTTITLGYDIPLQDIHQALMAAAYATAHILHEPAPCVWQTSLDDFYVSYQLNAYTAQPILMYTIYSELIANILQKCDEAGIEILSPHYAALRDGNESTLSPEHLTPDSKIPGFRIYPMNRDSR